MPKKQAAEAPDLMRVFGDLVRCETRLYNGIGRTLRSEHGITTAQYELLLFVRERQDCRVGDLAREFAIAIGAASKSVDRLEASGWVRRRPNPRNRRSSLLSLTDEGRQLIDAATPTFEGELQALIAVPTTGAQLADLAATLSLLRRTLEEAGVGRPLG